MIMLWNNLMRLTAAVVPCDQCKRHLSEYMRTHTFVRFPRIHLVTGQMVKERAVAEVHALHNAVNLRLGRPVFPVVDLVVYKRHRKESIDIINKAYDEVKAAWTPLLHDRISGPAFNEWKKHLSMMIALAACGPA